jgi:nucleoside-diphosphate-sugar epimerase
MPFNESSLVNQPISPYAASKKAAEDLAYTYHVQYKIDVSVLRYFTVFGPLGRPDMAPYRFVKSVLEGIPLFLFGDGNQKRDFTYVDDIAAGTLLAEKTLGYEIINIGGGNEPVTINEFIGWIETLAGKKAFIDRKPIHPADMLETHADISKAKSLLGWEPNVSPYEGLKRMMEDTSLFRFKI